MGLGIKDFSVKGFRVTDSLGLKDFRVKGI